MCGRYGLKTTFATLAKLLRAEPVGEDAFDGPGPAGAAPAAAEWGPDYNIAPTDPAPVLWATPDGGRRLGLFRWGLVPFWAPDPKVGARMINARADTIATKPAFRDAFRERRLLVPASGWYEWEAPAACATGDDKKPQPHWLHPPEEPANDAPEALLLFAGLWSKWRDKASNATRHTFTIVTTEAAPSTRAIHDRMPVIIPAAAQALWLAPDAAPHELQALLTPYTGALAHHAVARTVNSVHTDGPALIAPLTPTPTPTPPKRQGDLPL